MPTLDKIPLGFMPVTRLYQPQDMDKPSVATRYQIAKTLCRVMITNCQRLRALAQIQLELLGQIWTKVLCGASADFKQEAGPLDV
jgi:hypothetical protein